MKRRKGFTLVELVIVIAVIVILAAVLIPTFSGVIEKANNAKDYSLVSEMNKVLALEEATEGKNNTMYEATLDLKKYGMDIEKLPSSKGYSYVWNAKENRIALLNGENKLVFPEGEEIKDSNKTNYFAIARKESEVNGLYEAGYSVYLSESNTIVDVEAKQGFDAGNNTTATSVSYTNSGEAKDAIIRTNSKATSLTINASNDTIKHYDEVGTVKVVAVDRVASYHEYGNANTLIVNDGHIVVENNATITNVIVEKSESEAVVSVENNGEVNALACSDDSVTVNGISDDKKVEIKTTLSNGGYIKLASDESISTQLVITEDTILDLNGHTVSVLVDKDKGEKGISVEKGTLTIIDTAGNGKIGDEENHSIEIAANGGNATVILNSGEIYGSKGYGVRIGRNNDDPLKGEYNSTFIMNGGKITGESYCIYIFGQNSKYYMNGGEVIATTGIGVSGNGRTKNLGTYIQINGGRIISNSAGASDCAIYLPQVGTTEINGGYIEGHDGINIKSGTLTINGGKIVGKGEYKESIETNNGAVSTGSAITISSSDGYAGNMCVSINGGAFEAVHSYAISEIIPLDKFNDMAAKATRVEFIQFNGGTYKGGSEVSKPIFIKYAHEKITWTGINSKIIKIGQ